MTLIGLFDLEALGEDIFAAPAGPSAEGRMFGGQIMAQALAAAADTIPPERVPHSFHAAFTSPADASLPLQLSVWRVRDGRGHTTRQVGVTQNDRVICLATTMWRHPEAGRSHAIDRQLGSRPTEPQSLPYRAPGVLTASLDLRWSPGSEPNSSLLWFRVDGPRRNGALWHNLVALYVSDLWFADPLVRVHGENFDSPSVRISSVSHTVWFHEGIELREWHVLSSRSPVSRDGLGIVTGELLSEDGVLKATIVQEALLRRRPPSPTEVNR
jgi:acyl-CoA thioesterase-2